MHLQQVVSAQVGRGVPDHDGVLLKAAQDLGDWLLATFDATSGLLQQLHWPVMCTWRKVGSVCGAGVVCVHNETCACCADV